MVKLRFHLSSALVMSVALGLALFLNVGGGRVYELSMDVQGQELPVMFVQEMGVPFTYYRFVDRYVSAPEVDTSALWLKDKFTRLSFAEYKVRYGELPDPSTRIERWIVTGLVLNVLVMALLLMVIILFLEKRLQSKVKH